MTPERWQQVKPGHVFSKCHLSAVASRLARGAELQGDNARARKAYEDFFALWKDADNDIPILIESKKEYEKLK